MTKKRYNELSLMAEKFVAGEMSANQVVTAIAECPDIERFKEIIQTRMKATADTLCNHIDEAASRECDGN